MNRTFSAEYDKECNSVDPHKVVDVPVLLQQYRGDVIRSVVNEFDKKGVSMQQLQEWQKEYSIIYPWDSAYYSERLGYNRYHQVYPLAIIMAKSIQDIEWALKKAIQYSVPFALKSGGHDHAGASLSNGFIINVSRRNNIKVKDGKVCVGSGTLLGVLITELTPIGVVLPVGTCNNTSVMFAAGAGIGLFTRKFGLTLDVLQSARVILADGTTAVASADKNPDLFWALRGGGGGNFGIITDMQFEYFEIKSLILYQLYFDLSQLRSLLSEWQMFAPYAPNDLASKIIITPSSDVLMKGQFIGESSTLRDLLAPYIKKSKSHKIWRSSVYESAVYNNEGSANPPWYFFYQTLFVDNAMNDATIDVLVKFAENAPHTCDIIINALGGRVSEIGKDETAFYWRNSKLWIHLASETKDQREYDSMKDVIQAAYRDLLSSGLALPGKSYGQLYINFKDLSLTPCDYMTAYYGGNKKRLLEIKKKYDPDNVFQGLHTIPVLGNDAHVLRIL
jgi:FAD/FMN-containing dehydrogenase